MKELSVPYFIQPDTSTCQSTCLKMTAEYVSRRIGTGSKSWDIFAIQTALKSDPDRPNKSTYNHYDNYVWWLNREFGGTPSFSWSWIASDGEAIRWLTKRLQHGYPVITSNRSTRAGHVILVTGVRTQSGGRISIDSTRATADAGRFVCHDPGGRFEAGTKWHTDRFDGAQSLASGGENGPGRGVEYSIEQIRRGPGAWSLLSAT